MDYFAYGSNLLEARLTARCPSAEWVGNARLRGYRLTFAKRSNVDGSGKCDIRRSGATGVVYGALYRLSRADRDVLDRIEGVGLGYDVVELEVEIARGTEAKRQIVFAYQAQPEWIDEQLQPMCWYRDLVVAGAKERGFPASYIAERLDVAAQTDSDPERAARERRVLDSWRPRGEPSCHVRNTSDR